MAKKRLLLWDHSFHQKTGCTVFCDELFADHYCIDRLWDESWRGGVSPSIEAVNNLKPDVIIFFQQIPDLKILRRLECQNRYWIPMWDAVSRTPLWKWLKWHCGGVKMISFSRELHDRVTSLGFDSCRVKFFPKIEPGHPSLSEKPNVFFWQRKNNISWPQVRTLLSGIEVNRIFYKADPDPGQDMLLPNAEDVSHYRIEMIKGWLTPEDYRSYLRRSHIFMAPRPEEGIGMSFLEAMSMGLCVVSPDAATANEYIHTGMNGVLYDLRNPQPLDLKDYAAMGQQAREDISRGHVNWEIDRNRIHEFLTAT